MLRTLVRYPTDVLRSAGARPVTRDEFAVRNFRDDVYDLSPATFADVDPALHEPGLVWGAAKAHVHLAPPPPGGKALTSIRRHAGSMTVCPRSRSATSPTT